METNTRTEQNRTGMKIAGHVPTLPWVRSEVSVRVRLGSGLASGKWWVGTWPVTRLDPNWLSTLYSDYGSFQHDSGVFYDACFGEA